MNTQKLDDTLRNCADADLTHHTPTAQDKHIDELINRLAQRDLDVARLNRQINAAAARIENHVAQHVEYERYIKELDAKCLRLTVQTMADACVCHSDAPEQPRAESEPSNAYDDLTTHNRFLSALWWGAKWTLAALVLFGGVSFLMCMGWVGGAV